LPFNGTLPLSAKMFFSSFCSKFVAGMKISMFRELHIAIQPRIAHPAILGPIDRPQQRAAATPTRTNAVIMMVGTQLGTAGTLVDHVMTPPRLAVFTVWQRPTWPWPRHG
jgi:hypothetical protein